MIQCKAVSIEFHQRDGSTREQTPEHPRGARLAPQQPCRFRQDRPACQQGRL